MVSLSLLVGGSVDIVVVDIEFASSPWRQVGGDLRISAPSLQPQWPTMAYPLAPLGPRLSTTRRACRTLLAPCTALHAVHAPLASGISKVFRHSIRLNTTDPS